MIFNIFSDILCVSLWIQRIRYHFKAAEKSDSGKGIVVYIKITHIGSILGALCTVKTIYRVRVYSSWLLPISLREQRIWYLFPIGQDADLGNELRVETVVVFLLKLIYEISGQGAAFHETHVSPGENHTRNSTATQTLIKEKRTSWVLTTLTSFGSRSTILIKLKKRFTLINSWWSAWLLPLSLFYK